MDWFEAMIHGGEDKLNIVNIVWNKPTNGSEKDYLLSRQSYPMNRENYWNDDDGNSFSRGDFS